LTTHQPVKFTDNGVKSASVAASIFAVADDDFDDLLDGY